MDQPREERPASNRPATSVILLVEDEPQAALHETGLLTEAGYTVYLATNGPEAVRRAEELEELSLVLMNIDLGAPPDGIEVAQTILDSRRVPIVFLSSHTDPALVDRAAAVASYGYVYKGSGAYALFAAVKMALRLFTTTEELRSEREQSEALLEAGPDMMFLFGPDGVIEDYRPGVSERLLAPPQRFVGRHLREALPEDLVEVTENRIRRVIASGEMDRHRYTLDLDGEIGYFESRMVPCGVDRALSIVRDVTDEYVAAKAVANRSEVEARLERQVEHSRRLVREVNHRIKNNFAAIESAIRLKRGRAANRGVHAALSEVLSMVASNRALYEGLLRVEESEYLPVRPLIEELSRRVLEAFSSLDRIRIRLDLAEVELETARAFPLITIIVELLTNAIKYAYPHQDSGEICIELKKNEELLTLSVCDEGGGFEPEEVVEHPSPGSGSLGLTLASMLAEQIGGTFYIESSPGAGTCGRVEFPHTLAGSASDGTPASRR